MEKFIFCSVSTNAFSSKIACGARESSPTFFGVFDSRNASRFVAAAESFPVFSATAELVASADGDAGEAVTASAPGLPELFPATGADGPAPRGHQSHAASSAARQIKMTTNERIFIQQIQIKFSPTIFSRIPSTYPPSSIFYPPSSAPLPYSGPSGLELSTTTRGEPFVPVALSTRSTTRVALSATT